MERKYRTSHQGIASYLKMQGINIINTTNGKNKNDKPVVHIEFDIDQQAGRDMGDAFFDGKVEGNLKEFHDAEYQVRQAVYECKQNR